MTIQIDFHSKIDLKIGISKKTCFNLKTAFSDYKFGWAINCADNSLVHQD